MNGLEKLVESQFVTMLQFFGGGRGSQHILLDMNVASDITVIALIAVIFTGAAFDEEAWEGSSEVEDMQGWWAE